MYCSGGIYVVSFFNIFSAILPTKTCVLCLEWWRECRDSYCPKCQWTWALQLILQASQGTLARQSREILPEAPLVVLLCFNFNTKYNTGFQVIHRSRGIYLPDWVDVHWDTTYFKVFFGRAVISPLWNIDLQKLILIANFGGECDISPKVTNLFIVSLVDWHKTYF